MVGGARDPLEALPMRVATFMGRRLRQSTLVPTGRARNHRGQAMTPRWSRYMRSHRTYRLRVKHRTGTHSGRQASAPSQLHDVARSLLITRHLRRAQTPSHPSRDVVWRIASRATLHFTVSETAKLHRPPRGRPFSCCYLLPLPRPGQMTARTTLYPDALFGAREAIRANLTLSKSYSSSTRQKPRGWAYVRETTL